MKYIATKYEGHWQLQELDRIPGLCWSGGERIRPTEFVPSRECLMLDTEGGLWQGDLCYNISAQEVSFSEFKYHARRLLGCKWEQEDL